MMPTPNLYVDSDTDTYANLHEDLKSTEVPLYYITDRVPEQDEKGEDKEDEHDSSQTEGNGQAGAK